MGTAICFNKADKEDDERNDEGEGGKTPDLSLIDLSPPRPEMEAVDSVLSGVEGNAVGGPVQSPTRPR